MRRAALAGHRKAQFEHGLTLFSVSVISGQSVAPCLTEATASSVRLGLYVTDWLRGMLMYNVKINLVSIMEVFSNEWLRY